MEKDQGQIQIWATKKIKDKQKVLVTLKGNSRL